MEMPEPEENLQREGFILASKKKGHLRATMGSDKLDADYDSINYVTPQGNMGYTVTSVQDKPVVFFCSITSRGMVATFPDPGLEMGKEIIVHDTKMHFTDASDDLKAMLDEHRIALHGENVIMNRPRLEQALDTLPQKIIDLLLAYAKEKGLK
jgi:hypothetical protein